MNKTIDIEGLGAVTLMDVMGDDVSVARVARVSLARKADVLGDSEKRLIRFLWTHKHTSPFRHQHLQFHIRAPIFVIRQWMKHVVGCAWNERSGRYVEFDGSERVEFPDLFYVDPNKKQGVGEQIPQDSDTYVQISNLMDDAFTEQHERYEQLLKMGLCREQARAVLGTGYFTECYWTCSLHAFLNFLELRLDDHTQYETRLFAQAALDLVLQTQRFNTTLSVAVPKFLKNHQKPH
jgi:thymidylate synthase (FAD)